MNRSRRSAYTYDIASLHRQLRDYQPIYPSIPRSTMSPYRKSHYLDASDDEIIDEQVLEITYLDRYPTLLERWGDDTKPVVRVEGDLKIEDYVEFDEIEPTVTEEISYEVTYEGAHIQSTRETHRTRVKSRNFRRLRKRRTKRKRTADTLGQPCNNPSGESQQRAATNDQPHECIPPTTSGK